jgi:sugar/nucleoside kinase (ribokinase family)
VTKQRVLTVGDVMVDIIVRPEGPIAHGSDVRAQIVKRHGGSGANQAAWFGHFEVPATLLARVGAADLRTYALYFKRLGVTPALVGDVEQPTGTLVTLVDADGERSFLTDRAANLNLGPHDLPDQVLDGISLLVVSGYSLFAERPRNAVIELMRRARVAKVPVAVDPASASFLAEFGPEKFLKATRGAKMVFPNEQEAALLSGKSAVNDQLEVLLRHYELVAIKRGAGGAVAGARGTGTVSLPAPRVEVRDTTGAGDAFLARFVAERFAGGGLEQCLSRAVNAGSAAAAMIGGQPVR